jgi:hypothetical protein
LLVGNRRIPDPKLGLYGYLAAVFWGLRGGKGIIFQLHPFYFPMKENVQTREQEGGGEREREREKGREREREREKERERDWEKAQGSMCARCALCFWLQQG